MEMPHSQRDGKIALVLAGGGLTGAVYEIGALRAIDDLLLNRTVTDFDIYIGTSAGALVASLLASGVSPETMLTAIEGGHPELQPIERRHVLNLNYREFLRRGKGLPLTLLRAWSHYVRHFHDMSLFDLVWSLAEALPSGMYDGLALERYLRQTLAGLGYSNSFHDLERELYIIATDLDTGERVVFGQGQPALTGDVEPGDVPISMAVAASSALPLLYRPVRIGAGEYVDGWLRGTASLDLAIERGASLVVCINPLVPYDNSKRDAIPFLGPDGGYLSEKGIPAIAAQVSRIASHAGLNYHVKQLRRHHPAVDIVLIEPRPDDYQMFFYNIMRYSARLIIAQHGFESVTLDLAEEYQAFKRILARHGISISRRFVIEELEAIQASEYDPQVIRRVMDSRPAPCGAEGRDTPVCQLAQTLAELEMMLDKMAD